ncbi:MAG: LysR family transcriptional regulator [Oscillibacter sp.]|nr:LysR family transcriptional regulator [Oscillibacter sp.]
MELRVLRYFLAVTKTQSVSGAAQLLNITQPTLSRQLMDLERELGVTLFQRGKHNRKVTLTEAGTFLRKHAEEIVLLADKTEAAFSLSGDTVTGDIYLCAGETDAVRVLARSAKKLQERCPRIHYHISSGDSADVEERLDKGLADFGIQLGVVNMSRYDVLALPFRDKWGVLMRRDDPLTRLETIRPKDLYDKPLILSRQAGSNAQILRWLNRPTEELNIVASYSLAYNAALMTAEGFGYTLTLDKLIHVSGNADLCFRPLEGSPELPVYLVWKKYQAFSRAATLFLEQFRREIAEEAGHS